jgi:hypothetical protein
MPELHAARNHSLYMPYSKLFKIDLENLFRRDNNELIKRFLDAGLDLVTVSERVEKYFNHGEAKSQGSNGLLSRKCVAGLSKIWIGKESHPLADTEDLPDDETLEHYRAEARIVAGSVNHELIARAGIARVAKAARVDKTMLEEAVATKKKLPADMMARIAKAISINQTESPSHSKHHEQATFYATGKDLAASELEQEVKENVTLAVIAVPETRQELIADRVQKMLACGNLRELARFIHSDLTLNCDPEEDPIKYETLLRGVSNASQGQTVSDTFHTQLKLAEIEAYARKFYGIDTRLAKKAEKEKKLGDMRASTAHNARARLDKSRLNRRSKEINRVAEFWNMPEIANAATVKHAHLIDRFLNRIAVKGYKPKKIICSPYLSPVLSPEGEAKLERASSPEGRKEEDRGSRGVK